MSKTLRDTGVASRIYRTTDTFSLNRLGASTIYSASLPSPPSPLVENKGGYQSHSFREMFPEWVFRYAHNLGWRSADLATTLAVKPIDQKTVLKYVTRYFHGKNNFSQACEVRIFMLYPKHDMDAGDIKKFSNASSPPTPDHNTFLRMLCPSTSSAGLDFVPELWPCNQAYAEAGQYQDQVAQRPFLYEWDPRSDPTFRELFRMKKIRHRMLAPGEEMKWSWSLKNRILTKRAWGISAASTSNDAELPIWRRGYPIMLVSVRGSLVHSEALVTTLMSNVPLAPTYGDYNFDVVERIALHAVNGPAVTAQQAKAVGFEEPILKDSAITSGDLDQWSSIVPGEQAGQA